MGESLIILIKSRVLLEWRGARFHGRNTKGNVIGKPERVPAPHQWILYCHYFLIQVQVTDPKSIIFPGPGCRVFAYNFCFEFSLPLFSDVVWKMKTVVHSVDFIYL